MVFGILDAVEHRVTHQEIRVGHIDLGPQDTTPLFELAGAHTPKKIGTHLGRAISVRAIGAGNVRATTLGAHFIHPKVVHIGMAAFNQMLGKAIQLLEEVGGKVQALLPVEAQPTHVILNRLHIAVLFL